MGDLIFITGGARSGKSRFAEELFKGFDKVLYIATAVPFDEEMKERIALHRTRRNSSWVTVEGYREMDMLIRNGGHGMEGILVDCVTIMVSNLMILGEHIDWENPPAAYMERVKKSIRDETEKLIHGAENFTGTAVIVSNETGMGIVPPSPLGRFFRDFAGTANQMIASRAGTVYFMVSGIPVKIKGD